MTFRHALALFCLFLVLIAPHTSIADDMSVEKTLGLVTGLGANDLGDLAWDGSQLWVEGSGNLIQLRGGLQGHQASDWLTYRDMEGFGRGSMSAFWTSGDTLIVSWVYFAYYETIDGDAPHGDGLSISTDGGNTWRHVPILTLFPDRSNLQTPNRYTTIWDIAVSEGVIWCSTTAGFLLTSKDMGYTWKNIIPYFPQPGDTEEDKTVPFSFQNPNHHGQCVDAYGDTVWVGTFQGMNLSTDAGDTWQNFSWPLDGSGNPTVDQWPGNFPVAVEHIVANGATHVFVASQDYQGLGRIGICHTSDTGAAWQYDLPLTTSSKPWNISFGYPGYALTESQPAIFVATSAGLMASFDFGSNWQTLSIQNTSENDAWDSTNGISSVLSTPSALWATSVDGLARSRDGITWDIFRGIHRVRALDTGNRNIGISASYDYQNDTVKTYAFPNPFSPKRSDASYSRTRIQYAIEYDAQITIRIYSYDGRPIRTLMEAAQRSGGRDHQEVWDGRDDNGVTVPNGVYFYIITTNRGDSAREKIMVLD